MPSLEVFVKNVRSLMAERGVKLKDLAEKIGVSKPYLSLVLNGTKTNFGDEFKDRIASFFNVSMARLYFDDALGNSSENETWDEDYERSHLRESIESLITYAHLESMKVPFFAALSSLNDKEVTAVNRFFTHVMREATKETRRKSESSLFIFSLAPIERLFLLVSSMTGQDGRLQWVQDVLGLDSDEFSHIVRNLENSGHISVVEDTGGIKRIRTGRDYSQSGSSFYSQDKIRALHVSLAAAMEKNPDDGPFFFFRLAREENLGGLPKKALSHLITAASSFESQGLFREAVKTWVEAGSSCGLMGDQPEKARCLFLAAQCSAKSGDLEMADELGTQSIAILRQLNLGEKIANTCLMLGNNWEAIDRQKASQWYELGAKSAPDNSLTYGRLLVNLAPCYLETGRPEKAEATMDRAQKWISGQREEDVKELKAHMDLIGGLIHYRRRNWAYAKRLFLSCLESSPENALDDMAVAHHNLGMIAYMEDSSKDSIAHLRTALEMYGQVGLQSYWANGAVELAKAYVRAGELNAARSLMDKCSTDPARSFLKDKGWFHLVNAAINEAEKRHDEAISAAKFAVENFGRDGASQRDMACACLFLAQVLESQNRPQAAKPIRSRAFKIYEKRHWNIKELHRDVSLLTPKPKD